MEEMAKSGSRSSPSKSSPSSSLLPSSPTFPLLPSSSPIPSPGTYQSSIISSLLAPLHNYNVSILSEPSKGNFKKCLWCFWLYQHTSSRARHCPWNFKEEEKILLEKTFRIFIALINQWVPSKNVSQFSPAIWPA